MLSELDIIIQNEGDSKKWVYEGYTCLIKRSKYMGHLCGYIGLPPTHKLYKKHYDDIDVMVHGGLTFADFWEDERDNLWYVGFDCAHYGDFQPGLAKLSPGYLRYGLDQGTTYKNMDFVTKECESLVDQLK